MPLPESLNSSVKSKFAEFIKSVLAESVSSCRICQSVPVVMTPNLSNVNFMTRKAHNKSISKTTYEKPVVNK